MSRADFEDIARLWQQEPDEEEERAFRALARRAGRRARLLKHVELGLGLLLAGAILIAILLEPAPATVAIGLLVVAAIGWSMWKRHLVGEVAAIVGERDRAAFVDAAAASAAANLRQSTIGLCLIVPGTLLGALLQYSFRQQGSLRSFGAWVLESVTSRPTGLALLAGFALTIVLVVRSNLRLRDEYRRLQALQRQYRDEAKHDTDGIG